MGTRDHCVFCLRTLPDDPSSVSQTADQKKVKKANVFNHLWNYVYHENVREGISSRVVDVTGAGLAQLTFTLSTGVSPVPSGNQVDEVNSKEICEECCNELEKLNMLHKQLEAVKKTIEFQMRRVRKLRKISDEDGLACSGGRNLEVCMAGSVVGKDNISQTLKFLDKLCEGMSPPSPKLITNPVPPSKSKRSSIQTETNEKDDVSSQPIDPSIDISHLEADSLVKVEMGHGAQNIVPEMCQNLNIEIQNEDHHYQNQQNQISDQRTENLIFMEEMLDIGAHVQQVVDPHANSGGLLEVKKRKCISERTVKLSHGKGKSDLYRSCEICGKQIRRTTFYIHLRTHTGVKPFKCELCDSRFTQRGSLIRHRRMHTGEKPYTCEFCYKAFAQTPSLQSHRKNVHKVDS